MLQAPADPETFAGNPLFDPTGQDADVENDGPVFFVAGAQTEGVVREFAVPDDTPLLIPILNYFTLRFDTDEQPQKASIRQELAEWKDSVTDLFVEIDGVPLKNPERYIQKTDFFSPGTPEPDSLAAALYQGQNQPFDNAYPSKAVGYWLMIEDLPAGPHTIHFGGESTITGRVDVTDYLLVA